MVEFWVAGLRLFLLLYRLLPSAEETTWGENQLSQLCVPSQVWERHISRSSPGPDSRKGLPLVFGHLLFILYNHFSLTKITVKAL